MPQQLLEIIFDIEKKVGRKRNLSKNIYQSRVIDIDILFYGNKVINKQNLIIPHPLLHKRKFVLTPLKELSPDLIHPVFQKKIEQLDKECMDLRNCNEISIANLSQ